MKTVTLKIAENVFPDLLKFLDQYKKNEIIIDKSSTQFLEDKNHLELVLKDIENGNADFISQEDFENQFF